MPKSDPPDGAERLMDCIARVASAAALQLDVGRTIDVILEQTCHLGASAALLFRAEPGRRELELVGQRGVPSDIAERVDRVPFDAPLVTARAARSREVELVSTENVSDQDFALAEELFHRTGSGVIVAAPLVAAGELVGVLSSAHRTPLSVSESELVAAVRAIADICASSLAAARALERHRAELEAVRVAALAMSARTSVIARDLRQPVNSIALEASVLAKNAVEPAASRLAHIRRSADHLARMVADLLDASRLEARQLSLDEDEGTDARVGVMTERIVKAS